MGIIVFMNRISKLLAKLQSKKCLKTIAGINNFNKTKVLQLVKISELTGADCVDISADPEIISSALKIVKNTALMVSSIVPAELKMAQELGCDAVELGNYEALHLQGIYPSKDQVLAWATEIMSFKKSVLVSVTIPGHLSVDEQVALAIELDEMGVDIIQTEGADLAVAKSPSALGQIEKVSITLANTIEIARNISNAFILTASGLSPETVKLAIAAGASGVGVGKFINRLESEIEQMAAIKSLQEALEGTVQIAQATR